MKHRIIRLSGLLTILAACAESAEPLAPQRLTTVSIRTETTAPVAISRAVNDNGIEDVNLYLYREPDLSPYHYYAREAAANLEIPAGRYRIRAVANMHADMGERTY